MARYALLQLCIFWAILTAAMATQPVFVIQPNDTAVTEGGAAVLRCTVGNLNDRYVVQWVKEDVTVTNNDTVYEARIDSIEPSRYTIVGQNSEGEFSLQIMNTLATDAGLYWCIVFELRPFLGQLIASSKALLTIDTFPAGQYPQCFPTTLQDYYLEGEKLDVNCIFRNADPLPELQWFKSGILLSENRSFSSLADVAYQWPLYASDNGAKITCVANETLTCDVGPVEVYFKPRSSMVSAFVEVIAGEAAVFEVRSNSNPPPSLYAWSVNGNEVDSSWPARFSVNGSTITIFNTHLDDDGTGLSCVVANIAGNTTATATLSVLPIPTTPAHTTKITTIQTTDGADGRETTTGSTTSLKVGPQQKEEFPALVIGVTAGGAVIFFVAVVVAVSVFVSSCREKRRRNSRANEGVGHIQANLFRQDGELQVRAQLPPRQDPNTDAPPDNNSGKLYFGSNRRVHVRNIFSHDNDGYETEADGKQNEDNEQRDSEREHEYQGLVFENANAKEYSPTPDPDIIQHTQERSEIDSSSESGNKRRSQSSAVDDVLAEIIPHFHFISDDSSTDGHSEDENNLVGIDGLDMPEYLNYPSPVEENPNNTNCNNVAMENYSSNVDNIDFQHQGESVMYIDV